jgi:hypothetical protein
MREFLAAWNKSVQFSKNSAMAAHGAVKYRDRYVDRVKHGKN